MPLDPAHAPPRFIYIACPWTPKGGGMFKVADYLIQSQSHSAGHAQLRPLDTRGSGLAAWSVVVLLGALLRLLAGRLTGRLAGVHVNMAERLSLFRKSVLILSCRALGLPVVLHLHAAQLHHFYRALPAPLQSLTRWVFAQARCCVVLGETGRRFVTDELRVPLERVRVLINGVPEPTAVRHLRDGSDGLQRVLFVGNLSERKGVSDLLAALALPGYDVAHTRVTLAGGGDVAGYQRKAQALGLQNWVKFEGWADQTRVSKLMSEADVLVLPSYDEGLPLVILEALAHGVAVLCTPVGEIPDTLKAGQEVLMTPSGDVPQLAAQLLRLLRDTALREHLQHQGRTLYAAQFSMARFFEGVAHIHQECFGVCAAQRESHHGRATAGESAPARNVAAAPVPEEATP